MTLAQWSLEDVEALCLEPLFLTADPMGPLLDQDEEEALSPSSSLEGKAPASPSPSFSSYASSMSPFQTLSPPPSPLSAHSTSLLETKGEVDSFPWLGASNLLDAHVGADDGKDDAFGGMEWMLEKTDLGEFDLDSLIGSCSSDDSLSSPQDLLASLDSHMDLDLDYNMAVPTTHESLELCLSLPSSTALPLTLPPPEETEAEEKMEEAPDLEVVVKSEPLSPAPPSLALELESGMDAEKLATSLNATIIPGGTLDATSSIVLSLPSPAQLVVVVTNKDEPPMVSLPEMAIKSPPSSDCEDDSGIESGGDSPPRLSSPLPTSPTAGSSRTKPYSKPDPAGASTPSAKASKVKSVSGAPKVVEKKLKKMEQNKTAATRYRQKKRSEQDLLNTECEELEKRNKELEEKAESISREIQYLKDLMEEVRRRRNKTTPVA